MRHRATSLVRVLDRCARCGRRPALYDVRRVDVTLGGRRHQLIVCADCDRETLPEPTSLEAAALGVDLANPVEVMEFVQQRGADPARLVRTAAYFLDAEAFATAREEAQRSAQRKRDEDERWYDSYAASRTAQWARDYTDDEGMGDPPDDD